MFKKIIEALVTRVFKARYIYFSREDFLSARPGLKASSASIYDIALAWWATPKDKYCSIITISSLEYQFHLIDGFYNLNSDAAYLILTDSGKAGSGLVFEGSQGMHISVCSNTPSYVFSTLQVSEREAFCSPLCAWVVTAEWGLSCYHWNWL